MGLDFVEGLEVKQAVNHWDLAVEAHNANFPDTDHDCRDICGVDPRRYSRTDILWASPECTHHSYARGQKAPEDQAERSRATMWDIPRFAEVHKYKAIIVENVVEARKWVPFESWLKSMDSLGYEHEIVFFNSQFALPTPQSRDRMYVVFSRKGMRKPDLAFRPPCWCLKCEAVVAGVQRWKKPERTPWGRYGTQYLYHCPACGNPAAPAVTAAATAIDWSLPAPLIGDRKRPLAEKTIARILRGLERLATTEPVVVAVGGNLYERPGYARVWSVDQPFNTLTGTADRALLVPNMNNNVGRSVHEPMGAVTGGNRHGILFRYGGQAHASRTLDEPAMTITGHDRQIGILHPPSAIVPMRNNGNTEAVERPMGTVTAGGYHHGLLVYNGNPGFVRSLDDAAGTVTGRDKQAILTMDEHMIMRVNRDGSHLPQRPGQPLPTIAGHGEHALVAPYREPGVAPSDADVDGMGFRMLQWKELLRAQHMHVKPDGSAYQLEAQSRKLSNEMRVKMIGNAVSSPVAALIGQRVAEVLHGT